MDEDEAEVVALLREAVRQQRMWPVVVTAVASVTAVGYVVSQAGNKVDDNVSASGPTALFGWALIGGAVAGITALVGFVQLSTFASLDRAMSAEGDEIAS